jgi:CubicO group peptidase (beta-lactamase class C family)
MLRLIAILFVVLTQAQNDWSVPPYGGCPTDPVPPSDYEISPSQIPQPIKVALEQVDTAVRAIQAQTGTVGISVGVVFNQTLIWHRGYGYANINNGATVL